MVGILATNPGLLAYESTLWTFRGCWVCLESSPGGECRAGWAQHSPGPVPRGNVVAITMVAPMIVASSLKFLPRHNPFPISSSDIFDKVLIYVRLNAQDALSFLTGLGAYLNFMRFLELSRRENQISSLHPHTSGLSLIILGQLGCLPSSTMAHHSLPFAHFPSSQATKPLGSSSFLFVLLLVFPTVETPLFNSKLLLAL